MPPKILSTSLTSLSSIILQSWTQIQLYHLHWKHVQPFLKMWMPFLTQDIDVHFRILFISKFELFKLHLKVRSFERMFEFNQLRLGPTINTYQVIDTVLLQCT